MFRVNDLVRTTFHKQKKLVVKTYHGRGLVELEDGQKFVVDGDKLYGYEDSQELDILFTQVDKYDDPVYFAVRAKGSNYTPTEGRVIAITPDSEYIVKSFKTKSGRKVYRYEESELELITRVNNQLYLKAGMVFRTNDGRIFEVIEDPRNNVRYLVYEDRIVNGYALNLVAYDSLAKSMRCDYFEMVGE